MSKKGGYYCAFKNCRGLSRRDKRSFFRFPKDPQRSKQWVRACDRSDLLEKTPLELFNSYRVCAKHFTDSMFLNDLRNRLQPNSVPMQLEPPELQQQQQQQISVARQADDSPSDQFNGLPDNNGNQVNNAKARRQDDLMLPDCQDSVAKLLSNCILQKISADEFFKATGIRINEPVSAVKASDEYLANSSPSDHVYSSTARATSGLANGGGGLAIDLDSDSPSSFSIEALSYQDLINSLPMSLISAPSAESAMEPAELPSFVLSDSKAIVADKLPDTILEEPAIAAGLHSPLHNASNGSFDSLEQQLRQASTCYKASQSEEACTQTDFVVVVVNEGLDSASQTTTADLEFRERSATSTQTESDFAGRNGGALDATCQTTESSSALKDELSKRKIRKLLQSREHKIKELKSQLQRNFLETMDNVTLKQYELLTDKFFPKETSDFVKIQARLFKKKSHDRKFTLEFKKQCLSLFLAGPRTYKNLSKLFCLPGVRDLQTLKY